jgi:hypothetical protein
LDPLHQGCVQASIGTKVALRQDPFFEQPYEAPAVDAAPAWEASAKPATTSRVSANIKSKRKVAALFKTGE